MNFKLKVELVNSEVPFTFSPTDCDLYVTPVYERRNEQEEIEKVFDVQMDLKSSKEGVSTMQTRTHTFSADVLLAITGVDDKLDYKVNWEMMSGLFSKFGLQVV